MTHSDLLDNDKANLPAGKFHKIIGISFLVLGIYYLISFLFQFKTYLVAENMFDPLTGQLRSFSNFMVYAHLNLLIPAAEIIAGLFFLLRNRSAWMLGMIVALSKLISLVMFFSPGMAEFLNPGLIVACIIFAAIYLGLLALLLSKPMRNKYAPTTNTWMLIIGIALIILADTMRMGRI